MPGAAMTMMASMQAKEEARTKESMMMQDMQNQQTHDVKCAEITQQGQKARDNILEKFSNDLAADNSTELKNSHDSASSATAA